MIASRPGPALRPIELHDAATFAALVRNVFAGLDLDPPPSAARLSEHDVRTHLAAGGGGVVADTGIAGVLWIEKAGGLYVSRVAVDPSRRGQGLAAAMIDAAEREAIRRHLPRLWLSTRLALVGNRRLFGRLGFVETSLHMHAGYTEPTFVDMEKQIGRELNGASGV